MHKKENKTKIGSYRVNTIKVDFIVKVNTKINGAYKKWRKNKNENT